MLVVKGFFFFIDFENVCTFRISKSTYGEGACDADLLSSLVNINVRLSLLPRHQVNKKHVNEIQYLNIRRYSLSLPYLQIPEKKQSNISQDD